MSPARPGRRLAEIVGVKYRDLYRDLYHGEGANGTAPRQRPESRREYAPEQDRSLRKSLATMEAMTFKDQSHDH